MLIPSYAEWLAVWAGNHQVDTSKGDDALCIKLGNILWDLLKERSLKDEIS